MDAITYKNYEIQGYSKLDPTGDREDFLVKIRNANKGNVFHFIAGVSGTYVAVNGLATDEQQFQALLHAIEVELDKGIEKNDHKVPIVSTNQELGSFYTDKSIADFMLNIVNIWKQDEDKKGKRWQSRKTKGQSTPHYPSVIDPAVGEGVFLKTAISKEFTKPEYIYGLDLDPKAVKKWEQIHLLDAFQGDTEELKSHFFHQNGLDTIHWEQHKKKYRGLLKATDIKNQQFNLVVGNPPFGGSGLDLEHEPSSLKISLRNFQIIPEDVRNELGEGNTNQIDLFGEVNSSDRKTAKAAKRLKSYPIEILFVERFLQLAKPGGWVAIVLPEGILANSNSDYVRKYITEQAKVEAIVSLPRDAFKNVGTNAKTSILFLRKYGPKFEKTDDYQVFMANTNNLASHNFEFIGNAYQEYYGGNMAEPVQITKDQDDNEQVMVRVDKTMQELMKELPSSRWDASYWHPKYDKLFISLNKKHKNLERLEALIESGTEGITYGQVGQRVYDDNGEVSYLQVSNVQLEGLKPEGIRKIKAGSHNDPARSRLNQGDVLLINGGVGSLGRACVFTLPGLYNISQDIDRIRLRDSKMAAFVALFLNSNIGQMQIYRFTKGVSGQIKIGFDHVKSILIPQLDPSKLNDFSVAYMKALGSKHEMQKLVHQVEKELLG